MLTLHLKTKYYIQVAKDEKTHEYRPLKDYWISRIGSLSPGDLIKLEDGYTGFGFLVEILSVKVVHVLTIPQANDLYDIYGKDYRYYYDIDFNKVGRYQR